MLHPTVKNIFRLILVILLLLLVFSYVKTNIKLKRLENIESLYKASNDTIIKYRNAYNQEVTRVQTLVTDNKKAFLKLQTKDKEIIELQTLVKSYEKENKKVSYALILSNQTLFNLRDSLRNAIIGYTPTDSVDYPIYERTFKDSSNKWIEGVVTLGIDTFNLKAKIHNKYNIVNSNIKVNWLKSYQYTEITNLNPYTETNSVKAYKVEKPKVKTEYKYGTIIALTIVFTKLLL